MMKTTAGWSEPICRDAASEEITFGEKKKNETMRCKLPQCHPHCCIGKACRCHQMTGRHIQPPHPPHAHQWGRAHIHRHTRIRVRGKCGAFTLQHVKCFWIV